MMREPVPTPDQTTASIETPRQFTLTPLMFEAFVCAMAMMSFVALAGPIARIVGLAPWQVGFAMTIAGVAWMVMARYWGTLSDRRGRRPIILFGLSGFALTYFSLSLFIDLSLRTSIAPLVVFAGLVIGRGVAGVFYAAVPTTAAALIADHTPPDRRAGAMAAIGASSAAGMVVGPGLAGLIGPFSLSLPLYLTAILPAVALVVLWRVLPRVEHHAPPKANPVRLADPRLRRSITAAFVAAFSVAIAQICVGFFALDRLNLDPPAAASAAGIALAVVGIALVVAQLALRRLHWTPERLIRLGSLLAAIGFGSVILATQPVMLWLSYAVAAFGMGWVYPSVSALAANSVESNEQGAAAGTVAASQGLGVILGPIVGTALYAIDNGLPFAFMGLLLLWPALSRGKAAA